MTYQLRPVAALCALSIAQGVFAQTTPTVELDPVVVTATRIETPLADTISSVDVITRQQIELLQPASIADLLQRETGVEIGRNGGPGTATSFFLRGAESKNVVILIDGVRAPADAIGSPIAVDITPEEIESIEILRGNAGAYYGESAIGGVIAIKTKATHPQDISTASIGLGSRGAHDAAITLSRTYSDFHLGVVAGQKSSSKLSSMDASTSTRINPDSDQFQQTFGRVSLSQKVNRNFTWKLSAASSQDDAEYDINRVANPAWGTTDSSSSDTHVFKRTNQSINATAALKLDERWASTLQIGQHTLKQHDLVTESVTTDGVIDGTQNNLQWNHTYTLDAGQANFGLDFGKAAFDGYGNTTTRSNRGLFSGLSIYSGPFNVQASLRHDSVSVSQKATSDNWSQNTGLLGLGYEFDNQWRVTGAYSTGFRAPNIYELKTTPTIAPEFHRSAEIGIAHTTSNATYKVVVFRNHTDDAINYVYASTGSYYENKKETVNRGVEISGTHQWTATSLSYNWVHQNPHDVGSTTTLVRRARNYGSFAVGHKLSSVTLGAQMHISGKRNDIASELPGYKTVDITASKSLNDNWTLRGKIENLTDERYELAGDYNTPRRGIFVNLTYQAK